MIFEAILNRYSSAAGAAESRSASRTGRDHQPALEKDRELRYQSASEFRSDLKRLMRDTGSGRMASADLKIGPDVAYSGNSFMVVAVAGDHAGPGFTNSHWLVILVEFPEAAAEDIGFGTAYERWPDKRSALWSAMARGSTSRNGGVGEAVVVGGITCTSVDRRRRYCDCTTPFQALIPLGFPQPRLNFWSQAARSGRERVETLGTTCNRGLPSQFGRSTDWRCSVVARRARLGFNEWFGPVLVQRQRGGAAEAGFSTRCTLGASLSRRMEPNCASH